MKSEDEKENLPQESLSIISSTEKRGEKSVDKTAADKLEKESQARSVHDTFNQDIKLLESALLKERSSTHIFPYLKEPMERISDLITRQESETTTTFKSDEVFYLNIYKMELERIKYLVKSYLRARIAKFTKYMLAVVVDDYAKYMSPEEFQFMSKLYKLRVKYFSDCFLKKVNSFGYDIGRKDMNKDLLVHPNDNEWVMVKCNKLITEFSNHKSAKINPGDKILICYNLIESEIEEGNLEMI